MTRCKHVIKRIAQAGACLMLACTVYWVTPLSDELSEHPYSTIITDSNGQLLGATIASDEQWRFPVIDHLPEKYITALLLFEDKRFYSHPGIDPAAIFRALKSNLQQGHIVSGGSTITMQLARLIRGNRARTYSEKFMEAMLAVKLEVHLSKEEILRYYASLAPFGGNIVGINAANWRYFNTKLDDISWAQAALLAVLPNNPSSIHPGKNRTLLLEKRNRLLTSLFEAGHLSDIDLKLALMEPLPEKPVPLPNYAPHLLATLKQQHPEQNSFVTHIDLELQKHLITLGQSYNKQYEANNIHNLAMIVIDNDTQSVIAYIGNMTQSTNLAHAPSVDIIQRPRSSGSLFKPFLFAQMVQQGYILPETLISDIPSYYDGYNPRNYDRSYRGLIRAKQALSQSLNVPAVRMLQEYGVSNFKEDLLAIGLTTLWRPAEEYGLTLILGGAETTLWDISNAFSRLVKSANGEAYATKEPTLFKSHTVPSNTFPISQGAAWLTLQALLEVNRPGISANWKEFSSSQEISWKTGTSYGWHDAWAVGTNGKYTVGIWAGNANGEEARQLTGTLTAAPVMLEAFSFLDYGELPKTPLHTLKTYTVCKKDGHLPNNDCETEDVLAPKEADYSIISRFHHRVHIDPQTQQRVHGLCEATDNMLATTLFLPGPVEAYYYNKTHADLSPLPPWRNDCLNNLPTAHNTLPFDLEYPAEGARIRIPVELDGNLGRIIFKAHHLDGEATLYWHLDDQFIDATQYIHEQAIVANPGWHQITIVDESGYRLKRWFKVI